MVQVSNFLWKTQIQIKKKEVTLILYSFTPSDMNFQAILMPKVILGKFLSQKIYSLTTSYLKYALIQIELFNLTCYFKNKIPSFFP